MTRLCFALALTVLVAAAGAAAAPLDKQPTSSSVDSDEDAAVLPAPDFWSDSEPVGAAAAPAPIYASVVSSPPTTTTSNLQPQTKIKSNNFKRFVALESSHEALTRLQAPQQLHQRNQPEPTASQTRGDLRTAASHGHHHSYKHGGWLDMGAWTGGKGSFGWYADFPVGGKAHHGYGK